MNVRILESRSAPAETARMLRAHQIRRVLPLTLVAILCGGLLLAPAQAGAFNPGAGGVFYACVKAKGKQKGTMRLVGAGKKCKHGQRKVTWSGTGITGAPGETGTSGGAGTPGSQGTTDSTLQPQIDTLTQQLTTVQSTLQSQIDALTGQVNTLTTTTTSLGLRLSSACTQLSALTGRSDALRTAIAGLGVNNALTLLGGALSIPALPAALGPYTCP
jgi:hypothetical protein